MTTRLFIGGSADGRRIPVDEGATYWCVLPPKLEAKALMASFDTELEMEPEVYKLEVLQGRDAKGKPEYFEVFMKAGIPVSGMIGELVAKYPDPDKIAIPYDLAERLADRGLPHDKALGALWELEAILNNHLKKRGE